MSFIRSKKFYVGIIALICIVIVIILFFKSNGDDETNNPSTSVESSSEKPDGFKEDEIIIESEKYRNMSYEAQQKYDKLRLLDIEERTREYLMMNGNDSTVVFSGTVVEKTQQYIIVNDGEFEFKFNFTDGTSCAKYENETPMECSIETYEPAEEVETTLYIRANGEITYASFY